MLLESPMLSGSKPGLTASTSGYALVWRQKKLVVRSSPAKQAVWIPHNVDPDWLVMRLTRSPVQLILLDVQMGVEGLRFWAEAAHRAGKPVYINLKRLKRSQKKAGISWKTIVSSIQIRFSQLLTIVLSSLMLPAIAGLYGNPPHRIQSMTSVSNFYVDRWGQVVKVNWSRLPWFNTITPISQQLFSLWRLIRGEISLSAAYFQSLEKSEQFSPEV